MKLHKLFLLTALSGALFSCKKENTSSSSTLAYQVTTTNRSYTIARLANTDPGARVTTAGLQWTSGTASANLLKFEAKTSSNETEFKSNIQQQIDLFAAAASFGSISIQPGTYAEIEFKAFLHANGSSPAFELNGQFNGTASHPIVFRVNEDVIFKTEIKNITVTAATDYSALNTLALSNLTQGISEADLNNATLTNGTIVISSSSNTGLYNTILNNLKNHHAEAEVHHH